MDQVTRKRAERMRRQTLKILHQDRLKIERLMSERAGFVQAARAQGATWAQIGEALGVSRQAVQKQYASVELPGFR